VTGAATTRHVLTMTQGCERRSSPRLAGDVLRHTAAMCYGVGMPNPASPVEDDEVAAEAEALAAAIAASDADPRTVPHEEVRAWLLRIANGEFDAPPPEPR
jgi:hypothetical protein